jgi:GT2 family glycosyltransferase
MIPEVSAVVVTHRSAPEAARCVESLRRAFEGEAVEGEVILVDCGSGWEEAAALRAIPAERRLLLPENRGYSGGVNAGLAASRAGRLLLCNADVVFLPGALTALLRAIDAPRAGAAAPLCLWDSAGRLRLPPGFAPSFSRDLAQVLGGLWPVVDDARFARFAQETQHLWERGGRTRHLAGAVLAVRRDVFDRAGRFDERFLFEYEETEWEERVRQEGFDLLFLPEARVHHLWAVSASHSAETATRRSASEALYRARRYGAVRRRILEGAARLSRHEPPAQRISQPRFAARPGAVVAFSPNRSGIPFAAADLEEEFGLPDEIESRLAPGNWRVTIFRKSDGRPLEKLRWERLD